MYNYATTLCWDLHSNSGPGMMWLGLSWDSEGILSGNIIVHILAGGWPTPLKNTTSSAGMMTFPTEWKVIKVMFQTTNQYKITNNWTIWVSENGLLYSPNDHLQQNDDTHPFHLGYHTFRQSQVVNHLTTNSKGKSSPILAKLTCMGAVETWHSQMHSYLCVEQDNGLGWHWKELHCCCISVERAIYSPLHPIAIHTSMNRPTIVQPKNRY